MLDRGPKNPPAVSSATAQSTPKGANRTKQPAAGRV